MSDATSPPKVLEDNRDALLKAELAALLHDLGKLSRAFVASKSDPPGPTFKHHQIIDTDFLPPILDALLKDLTVHIDEPSVLQDEAPFADFIELHHTPRPRSMGPLVKLLSAEDRGADGSDSGVDKGTPGRQQKPGTTYLATAFGVEKGFAPEELDTLRQALADGLDQLLNQIHLSPELRSALIKEKKGPGIVIEKDRVVIGGVVLPRKGAGEKTNPSLGAQSALSAEPSVRPIDAMDLQTLHALRRLIQAAFQRALGETRRAANDVTLWDHSYSVASLYKAALAGILLDGKYREPRTLKWRFFRVGFDGLGIAAKGHKIGDILGYQATLEKAQEAVRKIVEFDWAMGNEVYRDENGIYFLVPAIEKDREDLERALVEDVTTCILDVTAGEVVPVAGFDEEASRGLTRLGGQITLTDGEVKIPYPDRPHPRWPDMWSRGNLGDHLRDKSQCHFCRYEPDCSVWGGKTVPQLDGCPVCNARPKCENQTLCRVCNERRELRVGPWLGSGRQRTIWIDEIADRNDRVAILVGRFDLIPWLDGRFDSTYLNTLLNHSMADWGDKASSTRVQDMANQANLPVTMDPKDATYDKTIAYLKRVLEHPTTDDSVSLFNTFLDFSISGKTLNSTIDSIFERAAQPVARTAENLATLLFRKHPSPARLRRIWETARDFWDKVLEEIIDKFEYDSFYNEKDPLENTLHEARSQRLMLFAAIDDDLPPLAYDATIGTLRLSIYWNAEDKHFITVDNLQRLMQDTGQESVQALAAWISKQNEIVIEEPITGQARKKVLEGEGGGGRRYPIRGAEVLRDRYGPYAHILTSPRSFIVIVPAIDAMDLMAEIHRQYKADFSKVKNRLPLHLGVVYFHRRSPLYAAMDAARRMLPIDCRPSDPKPWSLADDAQKPDGDGKVKLRFDNGIEWTVDTSTGDSTVPDDYYPYFLVDADTHPAMILSVPDPTKEEDKRRSLPLVHARDLKKDDKVRVDPSLFDFEFLDTIGRRFEVSYADGQRRPREGLGGPRPYYLDRLADFRCLWWLLSGHYGAEFHGGNKGLTPTQLSNIETLIGTRAQEWGRGDWTVLQRDPAFRRFACDTLIRVGRREWWDHLGRTAEETKAYQDLLVQAACDGTLLDVIELYRKSMKVKPLGKEVD